MAENSFDIVSKADLQEVSNAIQQALKEVHTRFDLKDSKSTIALEGKEAIGLTAGASAPEALIREIIKGLEALGVRKVTQLEGIEENVTFPLPKGLGANAAG